ncbi:hypothetical protein [Salibacterium aidingense]|uniref:hypothetical protein n=1 Tax=Salibacterium aidingense TaxID=384933 RepID=UPI0003FA899C|nr:hypothetical protein [Salibacterium aidingense]
MKGRSGGRRLQREEQQPKIPSNGVSPFDEAEALPAESVRLERRLFRRLLE